MLNEKEERYLEYDKRRIQVFLNLTTANQSRIYGYILSFVPQISDADDIMQETTLLMWEKFSDYTEGTDFVAWAMAIARFKALGFIQKKQRGEHCLDQDVLSRLAGESELFMRTIDVHIEALHHCVKKLPRNDAKLIHLRYQQEGTIKSISERLGYAEKTIYKALARIHNMLLHCVRVRLRTEGAL